MTSYVDDHANSKLCTLAVSVKLRVGIFMLCFCQVRAWFIGLISSILMNLLVQKAIRDEEARTREQNVRFAIRVTEIEKARRIEEFHKHVSMLHQLRLVRHSGHFQAVTEFLRLSRKHHAGTQYFC